MDPSQYYSGYDPSRTRSLASTTDPSRYMQSTPQYTDVPSYPSQQGHYTAQQRMEYQVSEPYPAGYHPPSTIAVAASASYPGAMSHQQQGSSQGVMPGSRSATNTIPQTYGGYGQIPSSYASHSQTDQYSSRHHHSSQSTNVPYHSSQVSPTNYPNYSHESLHHTSSSQPRRSQASASPVNIPPASPTGIERYACDRCDKTFSRAHDRKRHFETHHSTHPASHKCAFCRKDFSRADSLKRHVDNGCDKDPNRDAS